MDCKRPLILVPKQYCHEPESSTAPHSAIYGEPVSLDLDCKVFLSHSGQDKDFVRRLYDALCHCYHGFEVAFFDEESLPKGKAINMGKSILEEARESALGVLVLTDNFFMHTQNPMLELEAFVAGNVELLPLFYEMSVEQFQEEERRNMWERKWKEWVVADDKLVDKWRSCLEIVRRYNGLEKCKIAPHGRLDVYIDEVVKQVARIIGPAVPMCGEDVYGKDRLCRMVDDLYKNCASKCSSTTHRSATPIASTSTSLGLGENSGFLYAYNLVGINGFPGLGKTTLCKCLCDFYFREMGGKVCYIDVGSSSESRAHRMQCVLSRLDKGNPKNLHNLQQLDGTQVENLLKKRLSAMKDRVFLAIDNVLPMEESQEEALIYLTHGFPEGSKIFITSRTEDILQNLISLLHHSSAVIEYLPALKFEEARDIFEHKIPDLHNRRRSSILAIEDSLQRDVATCVSMCTIFNNNFYWKRYHPLMLKSLAAFVSLDRLTPGLNWKGRLAKLASTGHVHKDDAWEKVFVVFDKTYSLLTEKEKEVFLDLALCHSGTSVMQEGDMWIKMLHSTHLSDRKIDKILLRLQDLCFISQQHIFGKRKSIEVLDLFRVFAKYKLADADSNGRLVLENGEEWPDAIPKTATHISILRCRKTLRTLNLRQLKDLKVLHLLDNAGLEEVHLSRFAHLRSLVVRVPACTVLRFIVTNWSSSCQSLKWMQLQGNYKFCDHAARIPGSVLFGGFRNLVCLSLDSSQPGVQRIDLTACANMRLFTVRNMPGLKSIRVPDQNSSHLEKVTIEDLPHLEELALTVPADSMRCCSVSRCVFLQRVSLDCTPQPISYEGRAQSDSKLEIRDCPLATNVDGLSHYGGSFLFFIDSHECVCQPRFLTETFLGMAKDPRLDFSRCKAAVNELTCLYETQTGGRKGMTTLNLHDAQHIGPFISSLLQKQSDFIELSIRCKQAGDGCGCDQNPPSFCSVSPGPGQLLKPGFTYCCRQVRDLSSLAEWHTICSLSLEGCTSVEVWPAFAVFDSLEYLNLRNTSLKEFPDGLHRLPCLISLDLRGCLQLPDKELLFAGLEERHLREDEYNNSSLWALLSLRDDLIEGKRHKCVVADALGALSLELEALFDRWKPDSSGLRDKQLDSNQDKDDLSGDEDDSSHDMDLLSGDQQILEVVLNIMYMVWFQGKDSDDEESNDDELYVRAKMRRLLSSESFLSFLFRIGSERLLPEYKRSTPGLDSILAQFAAIWGIGIALVGGASLAYSSYSSLPSAIDHHLRDSTIIYFKRHLHYLSLDQLTRNFIQHNHGYFEDFYKFYDLWSNEEEINELRERVRVGLCAMAREAGLETEEIDTESEAETTD